MKLRVESDVMGVRLSRKKTALCLIAAGALALAFGCYLMFFETKGYVATTATIERIEEHWTGDDTTYEVYVRYTADGSVYHGKSDVYSAGYREGKQIKIFYNPNNPEQIHGDSQNMGIYLIILGPVLALIGTAYLKGKLE